MPSSSSAQSANRPLGRLSGTVTVKTAEGKQIEDRSIIILEPLFLTDATLFKPQTHVMRMSGKTFGPKYLVARLGDSVSFVNQDNFDHNVFSPSQQDEFDLGSYPFGGKRSHVFREVGLSKIYCNVHSKMAAFILVYKSGWAVVSEPDGSFRFNQLPMGNYKLVVWNLRGKTERHITISPKKSLPLELTVTGMSNIDLSHPNKFGEQYREEEEDEIY